ncbi:MAG: pantetheine-phosphate adenylyltransferase [Muribaculaceae bacterium]|nr:pantetheine-phosphate adenylyltransferase [Muribaculaceae bacterium]MDE5857866.1 pantetheine-phosphate adenylyltransferase [Muribaculaceae bacterium]
MSNKEVRIGVFPGSFNPFTIGHYSIVERSVGLFDKLYVAVGYNTDKDITATIDERVEAIKKSLYRFNNVEVVAYTGLTVDVCRAVNARYIVRGIRSVADFEYERNIADINRKISGLETILFFSLPEHGAVSSSIVRELERFGADITNFLPSDKQ